MTSLTLQSITSNICDLNLCVESSSIKWQSLSADSIHVRMDGKAIQDNSIPKCDCCIFYDNSQLNKTIVFLIEVKGASPDRKEVINQLQTCYDKYPEFTNSLDNNCISTDEITRMLPTPFEGDDSMVRLLLRILDRITRNKTTIIPILYATKNISRLKRTGSIPSFKLYNGQHIFFILSGQNLDTIFKSFQL